MMNLPVLYRNPINIARFLLMMLDAIHLIDVSDTQGYGTFDYLGKGMSSSWHEYLLRMAQYASDHLAKAECVCQHAMRMAHCHVILSEAKDLCGAYRSSAGFRSFASLRMTCPGQFFIACCDIVMLRKASYGRFRSRTNGNALRAMVPAGRRCCHKGLEK